MKTKIYALRDGHYIRYVGKTIKPLSYRLSRHLRGARKGGIVHKYNWIRSMLLQGRIPRITLLEEVEGNGSKEEIAWIKYFRDGGVDLTNLTDGGEGVSGLVPSVEHRRKIGDANRGNRWHKSPAEIERMRKAGLGNKHGCGHIPWNKNKTLTKEHRTKIKVSLLSYYREPKA